MFLALLSKSCFVSDAQRIQKDFRETLELIKAIKMHYKNHLDLHITLICSKGDTNEFLVTFSSLQPRSIDPMPSGSFKIQHNSKTGAWKCKLPSVCLAIVLSAISCLF